MINQFILLTPLILLPILLLFAFVGCGLSTGGIPPWKGIMLNFNRDNLLQIGLDTINVTFTITTSLGVSPHWSTQKIINWNINNDLGWWIQYQPQLSGNGAFDVTCEVNLSNSGNPSVHLPATPSTQYYLPLSDFDGWVQFNLVVDTVNGWQVTNGPVLPPGA